MTERKMQAINNWVKTVNKNSLDVQDALAIAGATMEMLEKLEPIYEKYNQEGGRRKEKVAFKIIAFLCIGIVAIELIGAIIFFFYIFCTDDIYEEDNSDRHIICGTTERPCIKNPVTAYSCYDCIVMRNREEAEVNRKN